MPTPMGNLNHIWSKLEPPTMIMVSLLLQIILIAFGLRRKYVKEKWIVVLVWLSYLFADNVATFSIGLLLRRCTSDCGGGGGPLEDSSSSTMTKRLSVFWSPFLLLHLGGPDTITAYSKKDNELWLRHLVSLVVQVVAVFYGLLNYWNIKNVLSILTIPIFISGLMKYGERTWVLGSTSTNPFAGPFEVPRESELDNLSLSEIVRSDVEGLCKAYGFIVKIFQWFVDSDVCHENLPNLITEDLSSDKAFKMVELELSLMFDLLYTKTRTIYSIPGVILRFFTLLSTLSTLTIFCIVIDKYDYSSVDVAITMSLLVGAVALEIYAAFINIFSNWTLLLLASQNKLLCKSIRQAMWSFHSWLSSRCNKKSWSISMGRLELESCRPNNSKLLESVGYNTPSRMCFNLRTSWLVTHVDVTDDLRERLFQGLLKEKERDFWTRGKANLLERLKAFDSAREIVISDVYDKLGFNGLLLCWHVATHKLNDPDLEEKGTAACEASILLADYMFYLFAVCPILLPKSTKRAAYLKNEITNELTVIASRCEQKLRTGVQSGKITKVQMWDDVVWEIWMVILIYAAAKCRWEEQVEQLGKGGELITHVWLLMVHLHLVEEFWDLPYD